MFKTVTRHLRFVGAVVASALSLFELVGEKIARRVKPFLQEGEEVTGTELSAAVLAVARILEGEAAELVEADRVHSTELGKERNLRKRRKDDAAALYRRLYHLRQTLEAYGRGMAEKTVGLDKKIAVVAPDVLERYARDAEETLSNPDFELPVTDADTFDATKHAKAIRPVLQRFEETDVALEDQKMVTQEALKVKLYTLEKFKKSYSFGKQALKGLYGLAGETKHMERLVPKRGVRKSKKKKSPEGDSAERT